MIENELKSLILSKFGTVKDFALKCGLPYSTVDTILRRGINKASVSSVIAICKALDISTDALANGRIAPNETPSVSHLTDICAILSAARENIDLCHNLTLDGTNLTRREAETLIDGLDIAIGIVRRERER